MGYKRAFDFKKVDMENLDQLMKLLLFLKKYSETIYADLKIIKKVCEKGNYGQVGMVDHGLFVDNLQKTIPVMEDAMKDARKLAPKVSKNLRKSLVEIRSPRV